MSGEAMTTAYKQHTKHCPCEPLKRRYFANVERLEKEAKLNSELAEAELAMLRDQNEQDKAQLAEAMGRVKAYHGAEIIAEQKAGKDTHDLQGCDVCAFLAATMEKCEHGCTIDATGQLHPGCARVIALAEGPKIDFLYMTRDQQPCERVSVYRTGIPPAQDRRQFECNRHGCPWPEEGPCPAQQAMDDPEFREGIKRGVKAYREGRMRPWSEVKKELGIEDKEPSP